MQAHPLFGWLASALMLATFSCRDARCLRTLAVMANLAFIAYGFSAGLMPVLALHVALLPINAYRLVGAIGDGRRSRSRPQRPPA